MIEDGFEIGHCYFLLGHYDRRFRFPYIQTFVFIGKNLDNPQRKSEELWFFQEPQSYIERGASVPRDGIDSPEITMVKKDGLEGFVDWSGLIDNLTANKKALEQGKPFTGL
jgi:hypothetical protein